MARYGQTETDHGTLVLYRSTDGGATWGAGTTIQNITEDCRDPALKKLADGRLCCSFTTTVNGADDYQSNVMFSSNNGATWGAKIVVTHGFALWAFCCAPVVELANGHLLQPMYGDDLGFGGGGWYSRVSRSTDGGATWADLSTIAAPGSYLEPNVTLHTNGRLYAALRTGGDTVYFAVSTDNGATWGAPSPLFAGSGRPAIFSSTLGYLVIPYRRKPGSLQTEVRFSSDLGVSWSAPLVMPDSASVYAYAQCVDMPDSTIGMVWAVEVNGGRGDLYFSKLTPT